MNISIKVYGEKNKVVKECTAQTVNIKFGVIRAIMELLKADTISDSTELVKRVLGAWDQLIKLLDGSFPDMTDDDWNNVDLKDVTKCVWDILAFTIKEVAKIPMEKNEERA